MSRGSGPGPAGLSSSLDRDVRHRVITTFNVFDPGDLIHTERMDERPLADTPHPARSTGLCRGADNGILGRDGTTRIVQRARRAIPG